MNIGLRLHREPALLIALGAAAAVLWLIILPDLAFAQDAVDPQRTLAFPTDQVITLVIGGLVPLVTYVLNHYAPWVSEPVKALVLVVVAAVAGGVYQAIEAGQVGFNGTTLQFVFTAVVAALSAHKLLWRPAAISAKLGGGSNRQDVVASVSK